MARNFSGAWAILYPFANSALCGPLSSAVLQLLEAMWSSAIIAATALFPIQKCLPDSLTIVVALNGSSTPNPLSEVPNKCWIISPATRLPLSGILSFTSTLKPVLGTDQFAPIVLPKICHSFKNYSSYSALLQLRLTLPHSIPIASWRFSSFLSQNGPFPQSLCRSSKFLVRRTRSTPPRNFLIFLTLRKILRFEIRNTASIRPDFRDGY